MNYLLLAPELFITDGGIARILRLYLKALCELSSDADEVRFVALNDNIADSTDLRRYSNQRLLNWEACSRSKLRFIRAAFRMSKDSDRIVCGHVAQLPVAWLVSKLRPRVSYYLVAHGIEVWRPFSFLERRALKGARCIFCVSEFTRQQLLSRCPLAPGRTEVLHNALDPFLKPVTQVSSGKGSSVVLSISRLTIADGYKGIGHLIAAFPAVLASMPEARLRIVGRGDGLRALQDKATGLGLGRAVEFAGFRSDSELKGEFENCRLFALPSEKEGFGLVYLEAMAHGRPCLGARSGGVPEVITKETGILVEYGDVPGIASAILAAFKVEWDTGALLDRVGLFSYSRFKDRLASLLKT